MVEMLNHVVNGAFATLLIPPLAAK